MKIGIVVGHNSVSQGAVRVDNGETEYSYNSRLADMMHDVADCMGIEVRTFFRNVIGGYTQQIKTVYGETDKWEADATIELHFNSHGDPSASGTETLSSGSTNSVILAQEVQMEMVEELGLKDRGILIRNSRTKGRGYLSLVSGRAPAILVEPFFGSNARGAAATDEEFEQRRLAECILEGAVRAVSQFAK